MVGSMVVCEEFRFVSAVRRSIHVRGKLFRERASKTRACKFMYVSLGLWQSQIKDVLFI